MSYRVEREKT